MKKMSKVKKISRRVTSKTRKRKIRTFKTNKR